LAACDWCQLQHRARPFAHSVDLNVQRPLEQFCELVGIKNKILNIKYYDCNFRKAR
jgi:hypothetical protein